MKIKKLIIYGYGKWIDKSFDLSEGLQVFLGKNEAGKSTLMSFIHSIFFGFPTRNSVLLRYEPLESSRYGGKIIVEDSQFGELIIERVHGKVTGDVKVTLEDGTIGSDSLLERILRGIDRENYQNIFSFSLTDIENVHQLNKNKLSRYLLNIGAHSTDYYLDLVDAFKKDAYNLYRPSGRIPPLNKELSEIKKQEKKLKKIEANNESYLNLIEERNKQDQEIKEIEEKIEVKKNKIKEIEDFEKDLHLLKEIQELKKEIEGIKLPYLKEDGLYLLEENKKTIGEINNELVDINHQIKELKESISKVDMIDYYQENKKEIKSLEQKLPDKVEELEKIKKLQEKIEKSKKRENELKQVLKIEDNTIQSIQLLEKDKQKIIELFEAYEELDNKIKDQIKRMEILESQISQKNEKADYYEELMWSPKYLLSIEEKLKEKTKPRKEKSKRDKNYKKKTLFTSVFSILIIIISLFISSINSFIGIGLGSLFFLLSIFYYQFQKRKALDAAEEFLEVDEVLVKEYDKQIELQSNWQNLLAEIDSIQKDYQDYKTKRNQNKDLKKEINKDWRMLINSHSIPPVHSIEKTEELIKQIEELVSVKQLIIELKEKEKNLRKQLEKDFSVVSKLLPKNKAPSLIEKINYFRHYLKEVNELIDSEQSKMGQLTLFQQKEEELRNRKKLLETQSKHLITASGVKTEEEFQSLYQEKKKLNKKKSRLKFLLENTSDFNVNKKLPNRKELASKKEKINLNLKKLAEKNRKVIDERAKTEVTIHHLEKDGRYSEALQEFENKKSSTQHLVDEFISDKLAETIIQSTLNQVTKDRFKDIILKINEYFSYLTDNDYSNIVFQKEELCVQDKEGRVIEVKSLSRGTAEPLYVAIRLAYIVKMQDLVKLPIIVDDPFVNFDHERKNKVNNLLKQLGEKLQIIYFSFDKNLEETFKEDQIIKLKE